MRFYNKPFKYVLKDGVLHLGYDSMSRECNILRNSMFKSGEFIVHIIALLETSMGKTSTIHYMVCIINGSLYKLVTVYDFGKKIGVGYIIELSDELLKYVTDYISNI